MRLSHTIEQTFIAQDFHTFLNLGAFKQVRNLNAYSVNTEKIVPNKSPPYIIYDLREMLNPAPLPQSTCLSRYTVISLQHVVLERGHSIQYSEVDNNQDFLVLNYTTILILTYESVS